MKSKSPACFADMFLVASSKPISPSSNSSYRADIDGLRAVAVAAVVINHINPSLLHCGHLGVDIFFVISGFVITLSLLRHHAVNPGLGVRQFLSDFYCRRIKRLMPALVACVLITSLIVLGLSIAPQDSLSTGRLALVGLSNIYLYNNGTNYNAGSAADNAFLQTWSLGVEEQFYFVYPLVLWLLMQARSRRIAKIFLAIALLSLFSFANYVHLLKTDYWAAFFLMPSRFWELGAGVLTCLVVSQRNFATGRFRFLGMAQPVLLLIIIASLFAPLAQAGRMTPVVVATTSAIIFAGQYQYLRFNLLLFKPAVFLGKISYSLYLWHWTVLYAARSLGFGEAPLFALVVLLASFLAGYASFRFIEQPLRHANWGSSKSGVLVVGIAVIAALVAAIAAVQRYIIAIYPAQQKELFSLQNWIGKTRKPCHNSEVNSSTISSKIDLCLTLAPNRPHALIIGNSHSEQYTMAIRTALPGWDVDSLTMWGCSYEPPSTMDWRYKQKGCNLYVSGVNKFLEKSVNSGDIVFLGYTVSDGLIGPALLSHVSGLAKILDKRGAKLVLMDDLYYAEYDDNRCESGLLPYRLGFRKMASDRDCLIKKRDSSNFNGLLRYDNLIASIREKNSNVYHFSIRNQLCPGELCPRRLVDGTPIYQDQSHLFAGAAQKLGPELRRQLLQSGLKL